MYEHAVQAVIIKNAVIGSVLVIFIQVAVPAPGRIGKKPEIIGFAIPVVPGW